MIDQALLARLKPAITRCRKRRMLIGATLGLLLAAVIAAFVLREVHFRFQINPHDEAAIDRWLSVYTPVRRLLPAAGLLLGGIGAFIGWMLKPNVRRVARNLERRFPDLDGRLTTALEQVPGDDGSFSFLQEHLFAETIHHSTQQDWQRVVPDSSLRWTFALPAGRRAGGSLR